MDERVKKTPEPKKRSPAPKQSAKPRRKATAGDGVAEPAKAELAASEQSDVGEPKPAGVLASAATAAEVIAPPPPAERVRRRSGGSVRDILVEIWRCGGLEGVRQGLRKLYHGKSTAARRFQLSVIVIDVAIIAFFIMSPLLTKGPVYYTVDFFVAALLALDLGARALATHNVWHWLRQPTTIIDLVILATMLAPHWLANFGFLRVLRIWTLSQTDLVWIPLRRSRHRSWEDPLRAVASLITFLFVVTGFVYTFFKEPIGPAGLDDKVIHNYVDALYFTVATVTTTGFGDITLPGPLGKLTSVVVMIVGISLFVRLAQAIFRPSKVTFRCPTCALMKHDYDAVHCKACGEILCIPDEDE